MRVPNFVKGCADSLFSYSLVSFTCWNYKIFPVLAIQPRLSFLFIYLVFEDTLSVLKWLSSFLQLASILIEQDDDSEIYSAILNYSTCHSQHKLMSQLQLDIISSQLWRKYSSYYHPHRKEMQWCFIVQVIGLWQVLHTIGTFSRFLQKRVRWTSFLFFNLKVLGKSNLKRESLIWAAPEAILKSLWGHQNIPDFYSHWLCYPNILLTFLNKFLPSVIFSTYWNSQKHHYFSISKNNNKKYIRKLSLTMKVD